MTMSPSGTKSEMDEEAILEAEIQQQLDLIDLENEDNNNYLGDLPVEEPGLNSQEKPSPDGVEMLEVEGYLKCLQNQTDQFEKELAECDDLVNHHQSGNNGLASDIDGLLEEAERSGVDPEVLRNKILEAIEMESEEEEMEEDETLASKSDIPEAPTFVTEDVELLAERKADSVEEFEGNCTNTLEAGEGVVALVDEIQTQEQFYKQQLQDMDRKYREREAKLKQETETRRKLELEKENIEQDRRQKIMLEQEKEKEEMEHKKKIAEQKLNEEIKEKEKTIQEEVRKFEEQITQLETETRREQEELEKCALERQEKHKQREITSATTIQACLRGYRVRKEHGPVLKVKREERFKEKEQRRIEEVEKLIQERKQEENKKKEEEERLKNEKLQEEEERKLEQKRIEEEKQLEEVKKKEEEEKQRKEEEEKLKREQQKAEEEKKRKEEEARKIEEEKKRKEEEREKERILKEKEERERIQKELEEKIEREKKEREEKERIERERAQKEKDKEEKVKIENEEKRLKEEEMRRAKEQKLQEENERLKLELMKLRGENIPDTNTQNMEKKDNKILDSENNGDDKEKKPSQDIKPETNQVHPAEVKNIPQHSTVSEISNENKVTNDGGLSSIAEKCELLEKSREELKQGGEKITLGKTLPEHIEARRMAWIKECLPWSKISNEPWKLKGGVSRKPPRCPSSAKKLSPLAEDVIIAAARVATLKQVTTVQLSELPGCNLSTLGQCWGLKSLSMPNCNLVALDGLQQCKQLQYLNVQRNKVEYVDLKDLGNLQVLDLSHNSLAVLHGLEGCTNIRWLDLSHNRITRLGGLSPLRRLHTLDVSSNQLICCSAVSDVPTLQHLDLSNNHLPAVDGISKLCLLQVLHVAANNILEFPDVQNQVLLSECDVSDNSISSLETLSSYWLPLLTTLNLAKNSLNELEVLDNLLLLKNLDVSNNQLLDLEGVSTALCGLSQLEMLNIQENPATDGVDYRSKLTNLLPKLHTLDGNNVRSSTEALHPTTDFETMCSTQEQFRMAVYSSFLQELKSAKSKLPTDDLSLCDVYFRYCNKSFKLAVEHRYAHEYGEISVNVPTAPPTPKSSRPRSSRARHLTVEPDSYLSPKEMFEKALNPDGKTSVKAATRISTDNPKDLFEKALRSSKTDNVDKVDPQKDLLEKQINSQGNVNSERFDNSRALNEAVDPKRGFGQALEALDGPGKDSKKQEVDPEENVNTSPKALSSDTHMNVRASLQNLPPEEMAILQELHAAATKIQATWRGFYLRLKLSAALEYARLQQEDDISEFDDFNMDEIAFDEESLEKGWRPSDTPVIPHNHAILGKPPSGRRAGPESTRMELAPVHPPNRPRQAWRNTDSPLSDLTPHPPPSVRSGGDTNRSHLSKREEKLAEEWGFHNSRTAELMLQRAKKMKLNSDKKRKLSRLDPKQRLALYRKLEEATKLSPIRPPMRKTLPRKEYFQAKSGAAREDEIRRQEFEKRQEAVTRSTRTYEWLHTQVNPVLTNTDRSPEPHPSYGGQASLTSVHQDLSGSGRLQMMNFVGFDTDSAKEERKPRRFSSAESTGGSSFLPPIKTGSAGSIGSEGRGKKKEKMSWRSKPTDVDVGWGGGRKRQK